MDLGFAPLRLFLTVADAGTLTAGSRATGLPLSTVSRQIAALEQHLGMPLFRRTARRLVLTEAGLSYQHGSRKVLAELDELEASIAGRHAAAEGLVRITAPVAYGRLHVLPIVSDYLARHPGAAVQLLLLDRIVDLIEEGVDLAVRFGQPPDSMVARPFGEQHHVVCVSPDYLARHGAPARPADLASHDVVASASVPNPVWPFRGDVRVRLAPRLVVNGAEAALDAATAGLGLTRALSYQTDAHLRAGRLVRVLEEYEPEPLPGYVVYPGGRAIPARVRILLDVLMPKLKGQGGAA